MRPSGCRCFAAVLAAALILCPAAARAEWDVHDGIPVFRPERPTSPPGPLADNPFDAAQGGVDWLAATVCDWMNTTGRTGDCADRNTTKTCFGCHAQAEAVFGLARSASSCYTIPATSCVGAPDADPIEYAARYVARTQRKSCILGGFTLECALAGVVPQDFTTRDGYPPWLGSIGHYPECGSNAPPASVHPMIQTAHGALNLAGYTRYLGDAYASNLVALSDWLVSVQDASGTWVPDRFEAPVDQGSSFCTGSALFAMATATDHADPARQASYRASMDRALAWVDSATHTTNQDKVFALFAMLEGGRPTDDPNVIALRDDLLDDQLPDGGWAERAGLESNAYATGQALWILRETGFDLDDPRVCSGVEWLVDHQALDGSWPMGQQGVNTDSSRNSGFTATMWPVMALGSIHPYGASVTPQEKLDGTCEDFRVWTLELGHAGDTLCGLFAQDDTYDLSVVNDSGDIVTVTPPSVALQAGRTAAVQVTWERSGSPDTVGSTSVTTLRAVSRGAQQTGCPVETEARISVVVPPDTPPPGIGSTLRVRREGSRLHADWEPIEGPAGGYDVVSVECYDRERCAESPTRIVLDAQVPRERVGRFDSSATVRNLPAGAKLVFLKVRATSPCAGDPGPTCDVTCTNPEHCWLGCP